MEEKGAISFSFSFDEDPYETTNLSGSTHETYVDAKEKLYQLLPGYEARSKTKISIHWAKSANKYWQANGGILPWADTDNLVNGAEYDYPVYCPSEATRRKRGLEEERKEFSGPHSSTK